MTAGFPLFCARPNAAGDFSRVKHPFPIASKSFCYFYIIHHIVVSASILLHIHTVRIFLIFGVSAPDMHCWRWPRYNGDVPFPADCQLLHMEGKTEVPHDSHRLSCPFPHPSSPKAAVISVPSAASGAAWRQIVLGRLTSWSCPDQIWVMPQPVVKMALSPK